MAAFDCCVKRRKHIHVYATRASAHIVVIHANRLSSTIDKYMMHSKQEQTKGTKDALC